MRLAIVVAISITPALATADRGPVIETKVTATHWDGALGDRYEMPDQPGDGGYLLFGYRIGDWSVQGGLIAHDLRTVRFDHEHAIAGLGADLRRYVRATSRVEVSFRAGFDHMWLYRKGGEGTLRGTLYGPGVHAGIGVAVRTLTYDQAAVVLTAELFRHDVWLLGDDMESLTGGGLSAAIGLEYQTRRSAPKKKLVWR